jgi:hypothetical protein
MKKRHPRATLTLIALVAAVVIAFLAAPNTASGPEYSSFSSTEKGVKLGRDLLDRLGWTTETRIVEFSDTLRAPAPVQVLVNASVAADEAHALLESVRAGGALLVAGDGGSLEDSLPTTSWSSAALLPESEGYCTPSSALDMMVITEMGALRWRRPPPPDTIGFGLVGRPSGRLRRQRVAFGFPLGRGRIVHVADANFLVNDIVRRCEYGADISFVRMMEYLSMGRRDLRVAYDEYHHGYGVRGGSIAAIRMYLEDTSSGRMLAQIGVAGLLLLFAAAPRPLAPRDPLRMARRSPLEHADALGRAYLSVKATRTATARLLAGVRRRARRDRLRGRQTDTEFLAAASALSAEASAASATVANALNHQVPELELAGVATALQTIEQAFTSRPTLR